MKEIPLRNRKGVVVARALVDDADYEWLNQWKWHSNHGYSVRTVRTESSRIQIRMHVLIMNPPPDYFVDHRDRNPLNCQRLNMRLATQKQNNRNAPSKGGSSIYKGVCWHRATSKWHSAITADYHTHYLGVYDTEAEAAHAYDEAAHRLHGEFAVLNFPRLEAAA